MCAPVHDAVLIEAPLEGAEETVAVCQEVMAEASAIVLGGFPLRTEVKVVRHPERYMDGRGRQFWEWVTAIMGDEGT